LILVATIVHAIAGYFLLLLVMRVLKRRAGSQMTMFDFVLVFLMGGIIILSTVGNDRSLTNCTCAVIAVGLMHRALSWAKSKNPRVGALLDGTPLVLVKNHAWQPEVAKGMRIRREDVEAAARARSVSSMAKVKYAILERNGGISIIEKESPKEKGHDRHRSHS
jgi:uncharacterized membrane protein YcaP (DUF421 family)